MNDSLASHKRKSHYLPLEQRIRLYNEVLELWRRGLSYGQIIRTIHELRGIMVPKATLAWWIKGVHYPLGNFIVFDAESSPELAGIIGTLLSDGDREHCGSHYFLRLRVKDKDYAEAFGRDLAKVLGKEVPYRPRWDKTEELWAIQITNMLLYRFLDRPWTELKPYIEHCNNCVARFLGMFIDGEGSIDGRRRQLVIHNTSKELLRYVQYLLWRYFRISSTGPHVKKRPGEICVIREGHIGIRKKTAYYLYIGAGDLPILHKYIRFAIQRKQRRLVEAVQR